MAREKEYLVKATLNPSYILYIACTGNLFHVMVTDEKREHNYSVYGGYKNLGTAANRLKKSVLSYHTNPVTLSYTSKRILLKLGALNLPAATN